MQDVTEMAVACSIDAGSQAHPEPATLIPWFALQIRQHGRVFCEQMLAYAGLEYFSPCTSEERTWSDRRKVLEMPLFPGYIFCRFDPNHRLPVLQTPGVLGVVSAGKQLLEIDADEIAAIRHAVRSNRAVTPVPYLAVGEKVLIRTGPFKGLEGIVERHKAKYRLLLSVSMLHRSVSVELDSAEVA